MRVLLLATAFDRPETQLCRGLKSAGVEVTIMVDPDSMYLDQLGEAANDLIPFSMHGRVDARAIGRLRKIIKKRKIQLVHSFSARAVTNALIAGVGLGVRHVAYRGTIGNLSRLDPSSWLAHLNPSVGKIICVSDAVLEYLAGVGVPPERLKRIYKGHDVTWYEGLETQPLNSLGVPPGSFVVACTANMRPVKGVDVLIDALNYLTSEEVHLLLIGEARDAAVLARARASQQRDRLHFLGYREDAVALVRQANAFCMPSRCREGFPKAVLEAMAVEVSPIVTRVGGMPELVLDGESGLIVPPSDAPAIAAAIDWLAADRNRCRSMGKAARQRIINAFSIETTVAETLAVYGELLQSTAL